MNRDLYRCTRCDLQTSITAGAIFQRYESDMHTLINLLLDNIELKVSNKLTQKKSLLSRGQASPGQAF